MQNIVSFIGLFCKRDYTFVDPTNRRHPIGGKAYCVYSLSLPQTSRANPVQCCSTHHHKAYCVYFLSVWQYNWVGMQTYTHVFSHTHQYPAYIHIKHIINIYRGWFRCVGGRMVCVSWLCGSTIENTCRCTCIHSVYVYSCLYVGRWYARLFVCV